MDDVGGVGIVAVFVVGGELGRVKGELRLKFFDDRGHDY